MRTPEIVPRAQPQQALEEFLGRREGTEAPSRECKPVHSTQKGSIVDKGPGEYAIEALAELVLAESDRDLVMCARCGQGLLDVEDQVSQVDVRVDASDVATEQLHEVVPCARHITGFLELHGFDVPEADLGGRSAFGERRVHCGWEQIVVSMRKFDWVVWRSAWKTSSV